MVSVYLGGLAGSQKAILNPSTVIGQEYPNGSGAGMDLCVQSLSCRRGWHEEMYLPGSSWCFILCEWFSGWQGMTH